MGEQLSAVVIGASGIGKQHAKWLHTLGCRVDGFVGSSPDSVTATFETLRESFGIEPVGYTDVGRMLDEIQPHIVNICSPPKFHYEHYMAAHEAGCHILCEKPLTWDEDLDIPTLNEQARQMAEAPTQAVRAVNTQYVSAPPAYYELCEQTGGHPGTPEKFFMQLESRHTNKTYERVWVDIATHPISMLMAFCGPGDIVPGSGRLAVGREYGHAHFTYQPVDGPPCEAEVLVRAWCTEGTARKFGINDMLVDYAGRNDENGVYCTYLSREGVEHKSDDFMYVSLKRFVDAVRGDIDAPLADIGSGYTNQLLHYGLMENAIVE